MNDIINRLQVEIGCSSEEQAFDLRHHIVHTQQGKIVKTIDDCCQKYSNGQDWLIIDKLEIDLGHFGQAEFEESFEFIFKQKFTEALNKEIAQRPIQSRKATTARTNVELVGHFLTKGYLPWWASDSDLDVNHVCQEILNTNTPSFRSMLSRHLRDKHVWKRISFQLNFEIQTQIIALFPELKHATEKFSGWIKEKHSDALLERQEPMDIKASVRSDHYTSNLVGRIIFFVLNKAPAIFQVRTDENALRKMYEEYIEQIADVDIKKISVLKEVEQLEKKIEKKKEEATIQEILNKTTKSDESGDKLVVRLSGIALIVPFLKPLFINLNWYKENQWQDKTAQYKAVHLLKYIETGETNRPEHELTLEKIFCGLPLEETLPINIVLAESETAEAIKLLEAVIEHWKALKNSSINSLRDTFFRRDGLIQKVEHGWSLQVERKTVDVLIDSIPWGISQMALPWNDYMIFVEW